MKYDIRLKMVRHAAAHGIKPTARAFATTVKTVRKWVKRYGDGSSGRAVLMDRSRAPHSCPHKTSPELEEAVVRERHKAPCFGAARLKRACKLAPSQGAIARILRQRGLAKRRKKKYEKKRDMRAVKAKLAAFEQLQVDTKYLDDLPYYVEQMAADPTLPRFQYTARCPKTGAVFLGFGQELSEALACVFVAAVLSHLRRCGYSNDLRQVQTDNGPEYSGAERRIKRDRGFTHVVRDLFALDHRFIPPGKKNHQADVESLHGLIEPEFFDIERFAGRALFFAKASAWQLWFNTTRENGYKGLRTPDQILRETRPDRSPNVWLLGALDLDDLLARRAQRTLDQKPRGYHLPALPGFVGSGAGNAARP